jgi:pre-mRNA-splicing factor ATP-dependent RNA helicase DHX16
MSPSLERYVSDNSLRVSLFFIVSLSLTNHLRQFLGISDRSTIDYVIASGKLYIFNTLLDFSSYLNTLASSSKSPESLFASLNASGLPDTPDAHNFISELFSRVPRKHKHRLTSDSARKQAEKDAKALRSQKFGFLLEDDEERDDLVVLTKEQAKGKDKNKREKHIRKREHDDKEWESDEEEQERKKWKGDEAEASGSVPKDDDGMEKDDDGMEMDAHEDENVRRERERLEDLNDRDAFAERMKDRDRERTKKIVEDRSSKASGAAAEAAQRRQLADDANARIVALPSLRLHSRQEYLTKRELQQIELLRKEIADDEALFSGMKISKRERRDLEQKKEVLKLVEARLKINDKYEGYQLPEDYITEQGKIDKKKKENALYKRYEDAKPKDDQFVTDVDQWEASQTQHSTFKMGAMDKKQIIDEYEYVFDESQTIQFVMESSLPGATVTPAERLLQSQIDEAEKRGSLFKFDVKSFLLTQFFSEDN